jgi:hypothetical protein
MTADPIDAHRQAVRDRVAAGHLLPDEGFVAPSPCGRYEIRVEAYGDAPDGPDIPYRLVHVGNRETGQPLAILHRGDEAVWSAWVGRPEGLYLVCPEALEGGQTVVHLPTGAVASVIVADDPFLWAEFHPSPDGDRLAVIGCYWACPYEVVVHDFHAPLDLPLPVLSRRDLPRNDWRFGRRLGPSAFTLLSPEGDEERTMSV